MRTFSPRRPGRDGFTLIELLVTVVILLLVLMALADFMGYLERVWRAHAVDSFAEAEDAFETMTGQLASATLEPYQDYADASGAFRTASSGSNFVPDHLGRRSDLAFVCGGSGALLAGRTCAGDGIFFLAPVGYTRAEAHLGLGRLLDALGYFVEFGDDTSAPSFLLPASHRWRWRLKEFAQPAESNQIYSLGTSAAWVQALGQAPVVILAENVIALVVLPERAVGDAGTPFTYNYDSRSTAIAATLNQLPPRVRVALVMIDEASARLLASQNGTQPPALIPAGLFADATKMDADLAALDAELTAKRIQHRILDRTILLPAAAWTNAS